MGTAAEEDEELGHDVGDVLHFVKKGEEGGCFGGMKNRTVGVGEIYKVHDHRGND